MGTAKGAIRQEFALCEDKERIVTKTDEIKTLDDDIKFLSEQSVILKSEHASLLEEKRFKRITLIRK